MPKVGAPRLATRAFDLRHIRAQADTADGLAALLDRLGRDGAKRGGRLGRLLGPKPPAPDVGIDDLLAIDGIDPASIAELRRLVEQGHDERIVVAVFLRLLIEGPMGARFGRRGRLLVRRLNRDLVPPPAVVEAVARVAGTVTATAS